MSVKFSLLHATYGRPKKAVEAMVRAMAQAKHPDWVEHIFAINSDDPTHAETLYRRSMAWESGINPVPTLFVAMPFKGSAPAWDVAAKLSTGDILIQMQDDLELPRWWDMMLLGVLQQIPGWHQTPIVIAVGDGYRKDDLRCTAICNRARYEQQGEFLHAGYMSVFSDDEFTIRAKADDKDGKCRLIKTDIVFTHRHHYHDNSVPMDATYERENSGVAYQIGAELFAKRNELHILHGLRTWG